MSQVAKYRQVESFIKDRIINGTYPVGTRIMTEEELGPVWLFAHDDQ